MERKSFLNLVGVGSVSFLATVCLGACSKAGIGNTNISTPPAGIDFTLDLSLPANAALANPGGYLYSNGIIVAHALSGGYLAVSQACTHQGVTVQYVGTNKEFYCPSHGAVFSETGAVTGGPANGSLMKYQTSLSGTMLRVFS